MRLFRGLTVTALFVTSVVVAGLGQAEAATWRTFATRCSNRKEPTWTSTACYDVAKLDNDDNWTQDYFQIRRTVTANSRGTKLMGWFWASVKPTGDSGRQEWQGADPFEPAETRNSKNDCKTYNYSVSGGSPVTVGYGYTSELCSREKIMPELSAVQGQHAARWDSERGVKSTQSRKIAVIAVVRVPRGKSAKWVVNTPKVRTD